MVEDNSPQIRISLDGFAQNELCFAHPFQGAEFHCHRHTQVAEIGPAISGKLKSPHALIQCLRHIIARRGYSYHLKSDGTFLWDDYPKFSYAKRWLQAAYCDNQVAALLQKELPWPEAQREELAELCRTPTLAGMKALPWIAVLSAALLCGCPKSKPLDIPGVYVRSGGPPDSYSDAFFFSKDGTAERDTRYNSGETWAETIKHFGAVGNWRFADGKLVFESENHKRAEYTFSPRKTYKETTHQFKVRYEFVILDNGDLIAIESEDLNVGLPVGTRYRKHHPGASGVLIGDTPGRL